MKAYKCDVCGKYCDDTYEVTGFDVYEGFTKRKEVREICEDCYIDIKEYIHAKVFKTLKPSGKEQ